MSRLPDLERALLAAAERLEPASAATPHTTRPRRRARTLVLAVALALLLAGCAFAATRLLSTGAPVPTEPHGLPGTGRAGSSRLLALRVPDPDGGPPWGIRTYDATPVRGQSGLRCVQVGRVQNGQLGVLGRDGVFHDDGRFHPLTPGANQGGVCGGVDADGHLQISADTPPIPASGFTGAPTTRIGGCIEHTPNPATSSPQTRRKLRGLPVCSPASLRIVKVGFAGEHAKSITYTNDKISLRQRPAPGTSGAYLFVLRPRDAGPRPLALTITYNDGTTCTTTATSRTPCPHP